MSWRAMRRSRPNSRRSAPVALRRRDADADMAIADDRLRLIFTCCHPALPMDARVALTLRTLGGLTTPEIARAFLVPEPTLAQRLVRAKRKIRDAGIPYRVPPRERLPERSRRRAEGALPRLQRGLFGDTGDALVRRELSAEAIRLARVVVALLPDEPEATGLLALMLLHDARRGGARRPARRARPARGPGPHRWDAARIAEGRALVGAAMALRRPGPYQIQAAIAALHERRPARTPPTGRRSSRCTVPSWRSNRRRSSS